MTEYLPLIRHITILPIHITVAEARRRVPLGYYGIIEDEIGTPLTCLFDLERTTRDWPDDQPLTAMKASWPKLITLPEAEAIGIQEVSRFFREDLTGSWGVVLG